MESREDVDDLLEHYLEEAMLDPVNKFDCEKKHTKLEGDVAQKVRDINQDIKDASASSVTGVKLWAVSSFLGALMAVVGGYTCAVSEVSAYKERVDNNGARTQELKTEIQEMRNELRGIRELLLRRVDP